jgi:hypothetical protein
MTMTFLTRGGYVIQNGSLRIIVLKVQYQNAEYVKFRGSIASKTGGWIYETKNYKLLKKNISHWEKEFLK